MNELLTGNIKGFIDALPDYFDKIADAVSSLFNSAQRWVRPRDPLVLDLDGDGIETVGANLANPILFDHDADGILTGTGWVRPDDGLLVMDRNGNGAIDNGRELFGDATLLPNGQTASDGFAALRPLDGNNDGIVNAADADFARLRVWRDLDQDGVSDQGELFTLASLSISGIRTGATTVNQNLGNGNVLNQRGTYVRSNGTEGTAGTVQEVSNLNFAEDTFNRRFTDQVPILDEVRSLPNTAASGMVRDLWEAASLTSPQGANLRSALASFAGTTTRAAQVGQLDGLLAKWAATSGFASMDQRAAAISTTTNVYTLDWQRIGNVSKPTLPRPTFPAAGNLDPQIYSEANIAAWQAWDAALAKTLNAIHVLEAFNGRYFFDVEGIPANTNNGATGRFVAGSSPINGSDGNGGTMVMGTEWRIGLVLDQAQVDFISQSYASLRQSVYGALATQTRLKPYLDAIQVTIDDMGLSFDFSALQQQLDAKRTSDPREAFLDLLDLNVFSGDLLGAAGWNGAAQLAQEYASYESDAAMHAAIGAVFTAAGAWFNGNAGRDLVVGNEAAQNFNLGDGADVVLGGAGNDTISGGAGANVLLGGAGNDTLYGAGTLAGGTGNDVINTNGGTADVVLFNVGDGADTVTAFEWGAPNTGARDVLHFGAGITPADLRFEKVGNDLVIKVGINGDSVRVSNWYSGYGDRTYEFRQIEFADGTVWDRATMWALPVYQAGTQGNDLLQGSAAKDVISGLDGGDTIYANEGDNTVDGGTGDDVISAGSGNDAIDGGSGNDNIQAGAGSNMLLGGAGNDTISGAGTLVGGAGNDTLSSYTGSTDTFEFNPGDGADTITTFEWDLEGRDVLRLGAGITPGDIRFERSGNDLVIKIGINGDQVKVLQWYGWSDRSYQLKRIEFSDGTAWDRAAMAAQPVYQTGTSGNDYLYGSASADVIDGLEGGDYILGNEGHNVLRGGAGDDTISAGAGDDTIDGGAGNDNIQGGTGSNVLLGGAGNDTISGAGTLAGNAGNDTLSTYTGSTDTIVFNQGDGADTITVFEWDLAGRDVLRFGAGIAPADVRFEKAGNDLVIKVGSAGDQIRVAQWYGWSDRSYQLNRIEFADGTVWDRAAMAAQTVYQTGTAGNDYLHGSVADDVIVGLGGDDTIYANGGNNLVDGGAGNDVISADSGNDTIDGGDGNDTIQGGLGANVLRGGAGADTISGAGTLAGGAGNDTLSSYTGSTDTFEFNLGDGADTITAFEWDPAGRDVLKLGAGITATDLRFERSGDDLVIKVGTNGDQVRVSQWYGWTDRSYQLSRIVFADGVIWDRASIAAQPVYQTGTAGNDSLRGASSTDVIDALAGNDYVNAGEGNNVVSGGAGDDSLNAGAGDDVLDGGEGNDTIQGGAGANALLGGAGNDTIYGAGTLVGGTGKDVINTNIGTAEVIVFNVSDGADTVNTFEWGAAATAARDVLRFGVGIGPADLRFERVGTDLVIKVGAGGDQVKVSNWYSGYSDRTYEFKQIEFADGTVWDRSVMWSQTVYQTGTSGSESLFGSIAADVIDGLAGNDYINAGEGNNVVDGGVGDDNITAGAGTDAVNGGDGNDTIQGGAGGNLLQGGAGNDTIYGAGTLVGGTGNDSINANGGTAELIVFGVGDGADTIAVFEWGAPATAARDVLRFGAGISPADLRFEKAGTDLVIKVGANGDQVKVSGWYNGYGDRTYELKQIAFADGTVWDRATIWAQPVYQTGTVGSESLFGSSALDVIDGLAGDDTIYAYEGHNVLSGGAGNDSLNAGAGNDTIDGGEGDDTIQGGAGANVLLGGAGNDTITGAGTLAGGTGNDVINTSGGTADVVLFNVGDGADTVTAFEWGAPNTGARDVLHFGAGITPADLRFEKVGNDLVIKVGINGDSVRVSNWYSGYGDRTYEFRQIEFADGTVWDRARIAEQPVLMIGTAGADSFSTLAGNTVIQGLAGNDSLTDSSGNNVLDGGEGNDNVTGGVGREFFAGGAGNDTLTLGGGADILAFNRGHGADIVNAPTAGAGQGETNDTVSLAGVRYAELRLARSGNDLYVKVAGTTDSIRLTGWYAATGNRTVSTLQLIVDSTADFDAASSDPLRNRRVARLNFQTLVGAFDAAYNANPSLGDWAIPPATLSTALVAGSDTDAIGGQIAYRYGHDGNLAGLDFATASAVLADANFGTAAQSIGSGPTSGGVRLMRVGATLPETGELDARVSTGIPLLSRTAPLADDASGASKLTPVQGVASDAERVGLPRLLGRWLGEGANADSGFWLKRPFGAKLVAADAQPAPAIAICELAQLEADARVAGAPHRATGGALDGSMPSLPAATDHTAPPLASKLRPLTAAMVDAAIAGAVHWGATDRWPSINTGAVERTAVAHEGRPEGSSPAGLPRALARFACADASVSARWQRVEAYLREQRVGIAPTLGGEDLVDTGSLQQIGLVGAALAIDEAQRSMRSARRTLIA